MTCLPRRWVSWSCVCSLAVISSILVRVTSIAELVFSRSFTNSETRFYSTDCTILDDDPPLDHPIQQELQFPMGRKMVPLSPLHHVSTMSKNEQGSCGMPGAQQPFEDGVDARDAGVSADTTCVASCSRGSFCHNPVRCVLKVPPERPLDTTCKHGEECSGFLQSLYCSVFNKIWLLVQKLVCCSCIKCARTSRVKESNTPRTQTYL
ncbi:uncharacterized protein LOC122565135 [Chiloscyllium plagiosum]|uniref:uncharacterized protein LOC122565135 n=1 Tax=Chiloscyllium plagiosum TaxID=36176 RepID=UPI001CB84667|nr:uncharacterized protein LOC122565135 [Chiloscyllium plagiosum]XP_043576733.1 uncharacterized protein LOC122565135 [Chiloscyllium plagiosum]